MHFQHLPSSAIFRKLWRSKCTPRLNFFAWLLFVDRLNTRNMLVRRHYNVQPNYLCVLCSTNNEENLEHLFFTCPFALSCWNKLGIHWGTAASLDDRVLNMIAASGISFSMEIFVIAAWEIWNLRNSKIFDNELFPFVFGSGSSKT